MPFMDGMDVIVVGGGLAGHCAALAAAEVGARVALLEKTVAPGGSSIISGGSFAFAGTEAQRAAGIDDSLQRLQHDLMDVGGGKADPELVRVYVDGQLETFQWLKRTGVQFHKVSLSSNTSVPRTHPTSSRQLIEVLHSKVLDHPSVHFLSETTAQQLIRVSPANRITGLRANRQGSPLEIHAPSVVLATGGFSRSPSMVNRYAPHLRRARAWGGLGNTGDGLVMSVELGATLVDMESIAGTFGIAINHYPELDVRPGDELILRMAMYRGAIAVNLAGKRFANESISYKKLGAICLEQPKGVAIQIFDQFIMDQSAVAPSLNNFRDAYDRGVIRMADTIRQLASDVGIEPIDLESTIARYNHFMQLGVDEDFGRKTLGGSYGIPVQIRNPPYYAFPCCTALLSTYCGIRINDRMEVLGANGKAIHGLYAAGEVVGGFHGAGYMSGSALGKAAIFGLAAGRHAARTSRAEKL